MISVSFSKLITKPVAGVTALALIVASCPMPVMAQAPRGTRLSPSRTINSGPLRTAYTLGGGDIIRINIFDVPQYSGDSQIPADGVLNVPLVGSVPVQGLTLTQAADRLSSAYARFLKRPIVTVTLVAPRPLNVFISGEVNRPGSYAIPLVPGAGNIPGVQYPTVTQAITLARGITLTADISRVELRRPQRGAPDQVIVLDFRELIQTGGRGDYLTLRDGDRIFVPTTTIVNLPQTREIASANFGTDPSRPVNVAVVGEVLRPGSYNLIQRGGPSDLNIRPPSLTIAIQQAGGLKPLADLRRVQIRRLTKAGPEQLININLWQLLQAGDINQDAILQEGDTIIVPTATALNPAESNQLSMANLSPETIQISVVGEVETPGTLKLPTNTTLNQALLSAGGFRRSRAKRDAVGLIRLNPDGSVSKRSINIDLAQGMNEQTNPMLRNNDIVVISRSGIARAADTLTTVLEPAGAGLALLSIPDRIFGLLNNLGIIRLRNDNND